MRYIGLLVIGCLFLLSGCGGDAQSASAPVENVTVAGAEDVSAINSAEGVASLPPIPQIPQDQQ